MTNRIRLFCSGELIGEVLEIDSSIDHGHVPGPDGYVKVSEPCLEYTSLKIKPIYGGQKDALEALKQHVRDNEQRVYKFEAEELHYSIRGRLTVVSLEEGVINMFIDSRKRPGDD